MNKRVLALVKYKPNDKRQVFPNGEILLESQEIHQVVENDGIAWDSLKLVEYSENILYESDLKSFNDLKNNLEKYKVILLKRRSYLEAKYRKMKSIVQNILLSDDTSIPIDKTIKETPSQKRKRVEGNRGNLESLKILLEKFKVQSRPMYFVNLIKFRDIAVYPPGYTGKQKSGKKASNTYGRIAYKYNRKNENAFYYYSIFKSTLADNTGTHTDWDTLCIVKYKSMETLRDFNTHPMFVKSYVHKYAGIDHTYVYAAYSNSELIRSLHYPPY
ncbi:MAG: hypothetical protein ACTSPS_18500 [Promethearchaeota archaeon]